MNPTKSLFCVLIAPVVVLLGASQALAKLQTKVVEYADKRPLDLIPFHQIQGPARRLPHKKK